MCYSSLCQLLETLLLGWYEGGMPVLCVLVFILASHIHILGYLLGSLPSEASLLGLLFLFLEVLPLCFLPLLGLFEAFGLLPFMALTTLQLRFFFAYVSFCTFNFYVPLQCWSSQCCVVVNGFPIFFYVLLWPHSLFCC